MKTAKELRDRLIEDGIRSVERHETRPWRRGGVAGFEICRGLETPEEFVEMLELLHRRGLIMRLGPVEEYWEYRSATAQVEFVFERLDVAWGVGPVFSARAILHVGRLLVEDERCRD